MYADDTHLTFASNNVDDIETHLNEDLANVIESVDLSTSPLSPFSGFRDILVSLLRGINQRSIKRA